MNAALAMPVGEPRQLDTALHVGVAIFIAAAVIVYPLMAWRRQHRQLVVVGTSVRPA